MTAYDAEFKITDAIAELAFRLVIQPTLPGKWFNRAIPPRTTPDIGTKLRLEIVSHCWKYSTFLRYQLSSLVLHPPSTTIVTYTLFYSSQDKATQALVQHFENRKVKNVCWNFQELPPERLFRRSIGRNIAALSTKSNWIWFTDCDLIFGPGAIEDLGRELHARTDTLVYPGQLRVTKLLSPDDPLLSENQTDQLLPLQTEGFLPKNFNRATGPIQIVHGEVARTCGYCNSLPFYQKSMPRWSKAYEDRAFRWLLGTQGVPLQIPNLYVIRHAEKGRYTSSTISMMRKYIRRAKSIVFNR